MIYDYRGNSQSIVIIINKTKKKVKFLKFLLSF